MTRCGVRRQGVGVGSKEIVTTLVKGAEGGKAADGVAGESQRRAIYHETQYALGG